MDGIKAVFFPEGVGRHVLGGGAAHAGGHQLDRGVVGDQLEGVLVAGDHDGVPSGGGILGGDGAHQVVRLPAVHLVDGDVHGGQHVLQNGHLAGQLVGHSLPGGFVAVIGQVAEGGSLAVKGDAQGVGVAVVQQLAQDIQKAEDGVGRLAGAGGKILAHPVKGPVDQGVAVQDHQFFHVGILSFLPRKG